MLKRPVDPRSEWLIQVIRNALVQNTLDWAALLTVGETLLRLRHIMQGIGQD